MPLPKAGPDPQSQRPAVVASIMAAWKRCVSRFGRLEEPEDILARPDDVAYPPMAADWWRVGRQNVGNSPEVMRSLVSRVSRDPERGQRAGGVGEQLVATATDEAHDPTQESQAWAPGRLRRRR